MKWGSIVSVLSLATASLAAPVSYERRGAQERRGSGRKGLTYNVLIPDGPEGDPGCKPDEVIFSDMQAIKGKGFEAIRTHGNPCSNLDVLGKACASAGVKLWLGVDVRAEFWEKEISLLGQFKQWDVVEAVIVGNEYIGGDLPSKFGQVRGILPKGVKLTSSPEAGQLIANAQLFCGNVDVLAANIHPFFTAGLSPDDVGQNVLGQAKNALEACGGKFDTLWNTESGWPKAGNSRNGNLVSPQAQATAIQQILSVYGDKTFLMSYDDEQWKPDHTGVEKGFGCWDSV